MQKYLLTIKSPLHDMEWDEIVEAEFFDKVKEYMLNMAEIHMTKPYSKVFNNNFFQLLDGESTSITVSEIV